jgi:hypothetical protein
MAQLLASPTSSQSAPVYQSDLARTIGVLQQLQVLCAAQGNDTSLADVIGVVRDMQHEYGEFSQLENVIQALVGQHLSQQFIARRPQRHLEAMEVLQ